MLIERTPGFPKKGVPGLFWMGQAGFWIETGRHSVLIDPYLSDSLARKYTGKKNDHKRMMPAPVLVGDLPEPDLVLVTHSHTDHMDPETLGPLLRRFPELTFVVPAACRDTAKQKIGPFANLLLADADQDLSPLEGLKLRVFPAAHEDLRRDELGQHFFLGYGIEAAGLKIYHSGDSIPFVGLDERIRHFAPDIALLPVNGRDAIRLANGIPGNFTLEEAIEIARDVPILIPHHWGMFSFNTRARKEIEQAADVFSAPRIVLPQVGETLMIG
ncbi:MBL fold metallo-hydrolase [Ruegeria sp. SCPT10]|uniref:MBL fold metallo-hydrolase n=1 Tax=Ruegeria sp. SCP10 TaxID=3141377 RepID=UPI003336C244